LKWSRVKGPIWPHETSLWANTKESHESLLIHHPAVVNKKPVWPEEGAGWPTTNEAHGTFSLEDHPSAVLAEPLWPEEGDGWASTKGPLVMLPEDPVRVAIPRNSATPPNSVTPPKIEITRRLRNRKVSPHKRCHLR
jgi:hypothetical protein